jgi:hypothetical protein
MFPPYTPSAAAALQYICLSFLYKKVKKRNNNNNRAATPKKTWWKKWWKNVVENKGWKEKWNPTRFFLQEKFLFGTFLFSTSTTLTPPLFHHVNTPLSTIFSTVGWC